MIVDGYRFRKNKVSNSGVYYECVNKDCRARIKINSAQTAIVTNPTTHCHDEEEKEIEERQFIDLAIDVMRVDPTATLKAVYDGVIINFNGQPPSYLSIKSTLYWRMDPNLWYQ